MFSFFRSYPSYHPVSERDYHDEDSKAVRTDPLPVAWYRPKPSRMGTWAWVIVLSALAGLGATWTLLVMRNTMANVCLSPEVETSSVQFAKPCLRPMIRREWRTLTRANRNAYIAAVQCLATKPSKLYTNGSLYDDFPRVHQATAPVAHGAAPFLPWHRYFVHAYESALKQDCGYSGIIPYWDWSQDWKKMSLAPVWDDDGGFGGDGARDSPITVGEGRCVSDGPFANLEARYFGDETMPHCLSRGFAPDAHLLRIGEPISPDALEELRKNSTTFAEYAPELEHRAHTFMRDGVRGDFRAYTGPYDPVFFLHHVNIDRLWALWQTSATGGGNAYGGPRHDTAGSPAAAVDDVLYIGNLLPSVPVSAVMETSNGFLCYQY